MADTGTPPAPESPREQGYLRACEGILRTRFGRRPYSAVARAMEVLHTEAANVPNPGPLPAAPTASGWFAPWGAWIRGRRLTSALAVAALLLGLALAMTLLRPPPGSARAEVGQLVSVVGEPVLRSVDPRSSHRAISSNAPVHLGDRLETGDADRAELQFRDGTTLRLGFNTSVELPFAAPGSHPTHNGLLRPPEVRLLKGQVWTKVAKLTNAPAYAIRTDAATAIARGTEFGVRVQPPAPSELSTLNPRLPLSTAILTVKEGVVDFTNAHGSVQTTTMTESTARADSVPTEPRRLQTLQVVQLAPQTTWSLITSPLDWTEAAERLVGGAGWAGVVARDVALATTNATTPTPIRGAMGSNQVRAARVRGASPAEAAGLKPGDLLLTLNNQPIESAGQLHRELLRRAGAETTLTVLRADQPMTVAFTPTSRSSLLPGPSLTPEQSAGLAAITGHWLRTVDAGTLAAPAWELGNPQSREIRRTPALRAAAENNLGVILELQDALGPAIRAYGRAVRTDPGTALYRFNLGLALRAIGSFERAAEELEQAARLAPASSEIRHRLADIHSLLDRDESALAQIEAALATDPTHHALWELKSRLLIKLRRPAESLTAARRALERNPDCPTAQSLFAQGLSATGDTDGAEAAYRTALALEPFDPVHHFTLGNFLNDQGRLREAEQVFLHAVELQPDFVLPRINLGRVLADQERFPEAEATLRRAADLAPDDAGIHRELGYVARQQRRFDDAEAHYRRALDVSPDDAGSHQGLAWTLAPRGNLAEAERLLRRACELAPDTAIFHNDLGEVLRRTGRTDEAAISYRRAIELDPADPSPRNNLAILQAMRGEFAEAEKGFRALIDLASRNPRIQPLNFIANLALACERQGKLDEAETAHRQALALAPQNPEPANNLAWFLAEHHRNLDEALSLARRAVGADPDNAGFLDTLGWVLFRRGELDEAERTLARAVERAAQLPDVAEIRERLRQVRERSGVSP